MKHSLGYLAIKPKHKRFILETTIIASQYIPNIKNKTVSLLIHKFKDILLSNDITQY